MKRELDGFIMNRMQGALARGGVPPGRRRLCHASRTSTSASATGWRCAGRSWGRSRPSTSTRRAACATMSSATSGSTSDCSRRCSAASTGPARCSTTSSATGAQSSAETDLRRAPALARPPLMALAAHKRRAAEGHRRIGGRCMAIEAQSHHHLRGHRRDPHAVDVAASADHAGGDRRRRDRRGRGRRGHRPSARARSRRTAGPTRRPRPSRRSCR